MCVRRCMHTLKSENPAIQMHLNCLQLQQQLTASKCDASQIYHKWKMQEVIICYYPVINIFCTSHVSAWEKLCLPVFGVYKHIGMLDDISPACAVACTHSHQLKKEILNRFTCASTSESSVFFHQCKWVAIIIVLIIIIFWGFQVLQMIYTDVLHQF